MAQQIPPAAVLPSLRYGKTAAELGRHPTTELSETLEHKRRANGHMLSETMIETIEYRRFLTQLLQLRPEALKRFEEIVETGNIIGVYYDLSNEVTPAIFVIIERDGEEFEEMIRLEGAEWKRPL